METVRRTTERRGLGMNVALWLIRGVFVGAATWALPGILTATWIQPLLDNAWIYSTVFAVSVFGLLASFARRG
ncbi:hypothetical protein [Leucobacter sp. 1207-22]|uniref:hypothetical protein n=1 Tax=Leucobacter sp. 1207-22 TaxID=2604456 RepID=UPI00406342C0